jgi:hypothetical protein
LTNRVAGRCRIAVTVLLLVAILGACSGDGEDAFCERVTATREAGPLFPPRTDGEPIPNLLALEAIVAMGDTVPPGAPDEVRDALKVLVDEAIRLVDDAEARLTGAAPAVTPDTSRGRRAVAASQTVVVEYIAVTCDIDLTLPFGPISEVPPLGGPTG